MKVEKQVWVIMDKAHRVIACGVPRHRHLKFVEEALDSRLLTYDTENKARSGYKVSQFYLEDTREYMTETYGRDYDYGNGNKGRSLYQREQAEEIYEAVLVTITLDVG